MGWETLLTMFPSLKIWRTFSLNTRNSIKRERFARWNYLIFHFKASPDKSHRSWMILYKSILPHLIYCAAVGCIVGIDLKAFSGRFFLSDASAFCQFNEKSFFLSISSTFDLKVSTLLAVSTRLVANLISLRCVTMKNGYGGKVFCALSLLRN